ncbi:QueT transporter family protein [Mogibacterium sp. NSJ-24]|uniref:QueT transporter family protein n=2 Tax=Lentihominibacter hominis TaxID=2763645 RepID=A0A926IA52_9FIRM|nr:QueT transporter family protein [Lentihominibacter hominis]
MSRMQKMTFSAMMMAIYIVVLYLTQSFSFGAYQIRIATSLYALSYLFPFLVFPLGFANLISNMLFGGFGIADMIGGCLVGILTTASIVLIRKKGWNRTFIAVPIVLIPGLGVAVYLFYFLNIPYWLMALNLCIGQLIPAVVGVVLVKVLERVWHPVHSASGCNEKH